MSRINDATPMHGASGEIHEEFGADVVAFPQQRGHDGRPSGIRSGDVSTAA